MAAYELTQDNEFENINKLMPPRANLTSYLSENLLNEWERNLRRGEEPEITPDNERQLLQTINGALESVERINRIRE